MKKARNFDCTVMSAILTFLSHPPQNHQSGEEISNSKQVDSLWLVFEAPSSKSVLCIVQFSSSATTPETRVSNSRHRRRCWAGQVWSDLSYLMKDQQSLLQQQHPPSPGSRIWQIPKELLESTTLLWTEHTGSILIKILDQPYLNLLNLIRL